MTTVEDLTRKLYDVCTKDGRESVIEGIDIVRDVVPVTGEKPDAFCFDILMDDWSWLRVTVSEPRQGA